MIRKNEIKKRKTFLPFGKPDIKEEDIKEVVDTLKSGWWTTGPKTLRFEKKFAKYTGAKYAVALNSCTAGLHLGLKALGVGPGDEVITTPLTFCATVNIIVHTGAKPVFADVDRLDWNIDPNEIEKKITRKTKVIIPVHLHGRPCRMDQIMNLAKRYNLYVLEDAAHAAEARYRGEKIGNIGHITSFSFYVTKNVATGEGGMVTTNDSDWFEFMSIARLHGLSKDAHKRYSTKKFRHYEAVYPGYKYNMMDIQASLGLHQLSRIEANAKIRKKQWKAYTEAFRAVEELICPADEESNTRHARHLYAPLLKLEMLKIGRDRFMDELLKRNIGTGIHFLPVHLHRFYSRTYDHKKGDFPNAEYVGERTFSLPLGANLSTKDIQDVIDAVLDIIKRYIK